MYSTLAGDIVPRAQRRQINADLGRVLEEVMLAARTEKATYRKAGDAVPLLALPLRSGRVGHECGQRGPKQAIELQHVVSQGPRPPTRTSSRPILPAIRRG